MESIKCVRGIIKGIGNLKPKCSLECALEHDCYIGYENMIPKMASR